MTLFLIDTTMDDKIELRGGYFSQYPKCVARNVVEGGYTERDVKFLTYLTEPQGKIENMKIVEEREAWIHTHFILDSFFVTEQERRQISINVEPELMHLGLQYGLTYDIAPSKHRAIIVLECIPFDPIKAEIKKLINDVIEDFPVRLPEQRNVVTNITVADQETEQVDVSDQVLLQ